MAGLDAAREARKWVFRLRSIVQKIVSGSTSKPTKSALSGRGTGSSAYRRPSTTEFRLSSAEMRIPRIPYLLAYPGLCVRGGRTGSFGDNSRDPGCRWVCGVRRFPRERCQGSPTHPQLVERRLRPRARGGSQDTPPSGASTLPGASGRFPLRSAADRMGSLGIRRMVGPGPRSWSQPESRVNSASSRSRRPGCQIGS